MSATNLTEKKQVEFCSDIWEYCIKPFLFSVIEFPKTCKDCSKAKKKNELHAWRQAFTGNQFKYVCDRCWCEHIRRQGLCDAVKYSILNIISLEAIPYYQQRAKASRVFNSIVDNKLLFKEGEQSSYLEKVVIQAVIKEQNAVKIQWELKETKDAIQQIKRNKTTYRQHLKTNITEEQKTKIKEAMNDEASLVKPYTLEKDCIVRNIYIKCPVVITL